MKKNISITKNYHYFIKVSYDDMEIKLNGGGICDGCDNPASLMAIGYLIPVLNSVYCEKCFIEWINRAEYYPEDLEYENMKTEQFAKALNR